MRHILAPQSTCLEASMSAATGMNPEWVKRRLAMDGIAEPAANFSGRLRAFANEIVDPLICRDPAYGAPGIAHCAACCSGTGFVITNEADQAVVDASEALLRAARLVEWGGLGPCPVSLESDPT